VPTHKAASVCQFLILKNVTTLYHPPPPKLIFTRLFSVPQVENEVKRTPLCDVSEIQEGVTNELKKVQTEEFSAAFQKLHDHTKACVYANGAYFE
jgi:hypothetical protein